MMTHPETDEQLIQIKAWLQKYGKWILGLMVVAVVAGSAMHYVRASNQAQMDEAALTFNELVAKLNPRNPETVDPLVTFAEKEHNSYGVFASLKVAQIYVIQNRDYARATAMLTQALGKTKEEALQDILLLRIARLQLQQNLLDEGLETLDKVKRESWMAMVNRIRGDVYVKQKHYEDSVSAYQSALAAALNEDAKMAIEMKLNYAQYLMDTASAQMARNAATPLSQAP